MFNRDSIYTVHQNDSKNDPADRVILVREGFAFWAFLLAPLWLLAHRVWRALAVYVIAVIVIPAAAHWLGLPAPMLAICMFAVQMLTGFYARDCWRASLRRRGYVETGVVSAITETEAQRRALLAQAA